MSNILINTMLYGEKKYDKPIRKVAGIISKPISD